MTIVTLPQLPGLLAPGQRLLGLDVGAKTLGLALSDSALRVASPLATLRRVKFTGDAKALRRVMEDRQAGALVLGLPLNMDGSEGRACESVRQFAANLEQIAGLSLPMAFWDERLSTAAVQRLLIDEADMTRKRRAQVVDKMAAAYILQGALDTLGSARA